MSAIHSFAEAEAVLNKYFRVMSDEAYSLDRIMKLLDLLGNPQNDLKVVHVAGTSGKTSTVYYTAALLEQSGAKVGLTVSPHMVSLNERVQINRVPVPEAEFCEHLGKFMDVVEKSDIVPTYFEIMVAFAFLEFKQRGVDYTVVEVGLGGLLDGTNVVSRADKVAVITDIGLDHMHILGNTIPEIAVQKAGIIQPGNHVFMYEQSEEVMAVVRDRCEEQTATLHAIDSADARIANVIQTAAGELPLFQQRNFGLAYATASYVLERDGRPALIPDHIQKAAKAYILGRMERLHLGDKTIILDGAHNTQKMATFMDSLRAKYPETKFAALVAVSATPDNRRQEAADIVATEAEHLILTQFDLGSADMPKKSVEAAEVAGYLQASHKDQLSMDVVPDLQTAVHKLLMRPESLLVITGSLYLMATARSYLADK